MRNGGNTTTKPLPNVTNKINSCWIYLQVFHLSDIIKSNEKLFRTENIIKCMENLEENNTIYI